MAVPRENPIVQDLIHAIERGVAIALPLFFAVVGLNVQIGLLRNLQDLLVCGLMIVVAMTSKIGSTTLIARLTNLTWRESVGLGVMVNCRGLTELVVVSTGLSLGIIGQNLFVMFVVMTLVTTIMTGPLLGWLKLGREGWATERRLGPVPLLRGYERPGKSGVAVLASLHPEIAPDDPARLVVDGAVLQSAVAHRTCCLPNRSSSHFTSARSRLQASLTRSPTCAPASRRGNCGRSARTSGSPPAPGATRRTGPRISASVGGICSAACLRPRWLVHLVDRTLDDPAGHRVDLDLVAQVHRAESALYRPATAQDHQPAGEADHPPAHRHAPRQRAHLIPTG